jgi:hypothetical protein
MAWLLEPYADPGFYRTIGYLLLGLPLGVFEFTIAVTGLSLGAGLAVTLLGLPVLLATFLLCSQLASFERDLAVTLLDAPMPREFTRRDADGFGWRRLRARAGDRRTWTEVGYLLIVRLPLGIADFTVAVTLVSLTLAFAVAPILYAAGVPMEYGLWRIDTLAESLVFVPISVLAFLTGPRLLLAWAGVSRRVASRMLGWLDNADVKRAVVDVLGRRGEADAFTIFDEAGARLGHGPFLTPTRVEATLLALESTADIVADHDGDRIRYALAVRQPMA